MNFALLGGDDESLALAQAAVGLGHFIVWCGDLADYETAEFAWLPAEDLGDQWQSLLDEQSCDAVIVGRGNDPWTLRAEQVNQLVRLGRPVLTTFPLTESVLAYYEIDMARRDGNAVLQHFNPLREPRPPVNETSAWVRDGHPHLGAVEQIVFQRPLADRTRENVIYRFARDAELLAAVAGRFDRLGAFGSSDAESTYAGLSVQLLGPSQVPVRWEVEPALPSAQPRLVLIAVQGKESIELEETAPDGRWSTSVAASSAIVRFARAVQDADAASSTWPAALRAIELADTIEISLRRGRMIDVHHQQLTEQLAFKGTMSAVGCGLLLVLPPALLAIGWLADQVGLPIASYWPHLLLALLALFLTFQLVPKLLLGPAPPDDNSDEGPAA